MKLPVTALSDVTFHSGCSSRCGEQICVIVTPDDHAADAKMKLSDKQRCHFSQRT